MVQNNRSPYSKKSKSDEPYIVKYANFDSARLIDQDNNFHAQVRIADAKRMAQDAELDLVCFNEPDGKQLAFCKIIDYGKWKYSEEKKKKKQHQVSKRSIKEIRFSPVIGEHDIEHKIKQAKGFLEDGDEVVFSMRLKGRQRAHFDDAEKKLNEIVAMCGDINIVSVKKGAGFINIRIVKNKKEVV